MKLGPLNTAIRNLKGAPKGGLRLRYPDGRVVSLDNLEFTKQSLLASLQEAFPGGRSEDTGLCIHDGRLCWEATLEAAGIEADNGAEPDAPVPGDSEDDLDDLLG